MTTPRPNSDSRLIKSASFSTLLVFLATYASIALAGVTDISNVPLASNNPAQAKPNIMLLMDTSGSMGWTHMPDSVEGPSDNVFGSPGVKYIGYKSPQCNALYYNPATSYDLPKGADGTFLAAPSFTAAGYDAYDAASSVMVDLSSSFKAYDDTTLRAGKNGPGTVEFNDTAQPAYYYLYTGSQVPSPGQAPCTDPDLGVSIAASGGGNWTKVIVSSTSGLGATDERQNFANWYAYYRTRIMLAKSAVSLAFNPMSDGFRIGFITVQPKDKAATTINTAKYLPIDDFNLPQRGLWYDKLFAQKPGGTSPAREGLARVGRYYAGLHDSINQGMDDDPLQFSCQQNFTILTTDGYWNDQDESTGGGPVKLDGSTRVDQQDGTLTAASGWTPRPIWEGFADGAVTSTDVTNTFSFVACPTGWFNKNTVQFLKSTEQNLQSTTQATQSTSQPLMSTSQNLQSTLQNLRSTQQVLESTNQPRQSTVQNLQSTVQNLKSTSQVLQSTTQRQKRTIQDLRSTTQNVKNTSQNMATTTQILLSTNQPRQSTVQNRQSTVQNRQSTTQTLQSTNQPRQSTVQNLQSTVQNRQSTTQTLQSTNQPRQSTVQNLQSTVQNRQSTTQTLQSTNQPRQSTVQSLRSTTQNLQATVQNLRSTSQIRWYNPATEQVEPVASCPSGGSCSTVTTGPTAVVSCTPATASSGNVYTTTTCTTLSTGPTGVASCTPVTASSGNNWTTTSCSTNNTTNVPVQTCTAATASSGNNWTTTSCSTNSTTNVPVQTCTAAAAASGNGWTTTSCSPATSGPTAVQTCTASAGTSGNSWVTTTCTPNNTTNVPVSTCTAATASSGNNWTTTTCPAAVVTTNVPVQTCTAAAASSGNSWTTTSCSTNNTTNVPVQTCTAAAAASGNGWTTTSCSPATSGPTAVQTCTASAGTSGNSWVTTTCTPNNTTNVPVQTCTAAAASSGNNWTTTTCPAAVVTTNVPVQTCTAAAASSGNSWTTTSCNPVTSGPTAVQTCTASAGTSGNSWVTTICTPNVNNTPVQTCTPSAATSANNWTTTTCPGPVVTTNIPVQTCTASAATSANNWTTTTCPPPIVTTNVPVQTCTASAATSANNWTTTTCPPTVDSGWLPVDTCSTIAETSANQWVATTCRNVNTSNVPVASCTPQTKSSANSWITITCPTPAVTTNVPVSTCTAAAASSGNSWTETTCPAPVVTTNVPVSTCTAAAASSGNSWTTTTCPAAVVTTNVPVSTCTAAAASSGNGWTTTSCNPLTSAPTAVQTCSASAGTSGNAWVTTTCTPNNTSNVPVSTCTAATASSGNSWTTTTCPAPVVTTNVPVSTCTAAAASSGNSWTTTTCPAPVVTTSLPVQSCTPAAATSGNNWVTTTCPAPVVTTNVPVQTCTASVGTSGNNWVSTTCGNVTTTDVPVPGCTPATPSAANGWTTTSCPAPVVTTNVPSASCTDAPASAANNWTTTACTSIVTPNTLVSSCTEGSSGAPDYIATFCSPVNDGQKARYQTTTTVTTTLTSGGTVVPGVTPTVTTTTDPDADLDGVCYRSGTPPGAAPALPSPNPKRAGLDISPWPTVGPMPPSGCSAWPCTVSQLNSGGSINSLADVSQYYYITDLRPTGDKSENNVPALGGGAEDDRATHQHMTTFTVALGVSGTLTYNPLYKTANSGDFADIRSGAKNWPLWPDPSKATWDGSSTYTNKGSWEDSRSIDDFWHTAVNGRGQYFSAGDPKSVINGLKDALKGIESRLGGGSAAGTSSQVPVAGDNYLYVANYVTSKWTGDVQAREIDPNTGNPGATAFWSAQSKLAALSSAACDNRNIYLIRAGASNNLVDFSWNTYRCNGSNEPTGSALNGLNSTEQGFFSSSVLSAGLSQYAAMTDGTSGSVDQRGAAAGANLVNFLRGQRGKEGFESNDVNKLYRSREAVLGDIINAQPVYVKAPFADYSDAGYLEFKDAQSSRTPMLYVAANDGMLHAFKASIYLPDGVTLDPDGGKEAWAIIPSLVVNNLYKLADNNYAKTHVYSVDGTPTLADIDEAAPAGSSPNWRSILVGGLNAGGRGYYALDVTDPSAPKALWEFKLGSCGTTGQDCHLGYTFGKPVITKLEDGTWVAMLTSGYNNLHSPAAAGDGKGYLYILKAYTGELLYKIETSAGDSSTPSGLAQINNYVDNARFDNTTKRVYGTDVLGNVWLFDVNDSILPSGREAHLLGTTKTAAGLIQPITTRPEIAELDGKTWLFVGTGRLLGASDVDQTLSSTTQTQSVYGFVDLLTFPDVDDPADPTDPLLPPVDNLHSALNPLLITQTGSYRDSTQASCDTAATPKKCAGIYGWVLDLPDSGERMNIPMKVLSGVLAFGSNVPQSSACTIGGYGFINYVNSMTGGRVDPNATSGAAASISSKFTDALVVGISIVWARPTSDGTSIPAGANTGFGSPKLIVCLSNGTCEPLPPPIVGLPAKGRRVSWRELINPNAP